MRHGKVRWAVREGEAVIELVEDDPDDARERVLRGAGRERAIGILRSAIGPASRDGENRFDRDHR